MVITCENRCFINGNELNVHDTCFYSIETKYIDGKYYYTFKANAKRKLEEEILFIFSGVTSCIFTGENHTSLLGESINSWYSLPSYPYGALATAFLTKEEMEELNQHGIYKNNNIRKNIRIWEHTSNISPEKSEKLFKVVFFFSTPAFLEIECEKLLVEKFSET